MEDVPYQENDLVAIAQEISKMCTSDQEMRERNLSSDDEFWDESVDIANTKRMKEIVQKIGWPTISKVGTDASHDAWLLVQHADHDIEFQMNCLALMKEVPSGDIDVLHIVYLEDRVRVNQGVGQLYGTQFTQEDERHIPRPIEDELHVDERRAAMGMGTLAEQIAHMYKKYPIF
jgi:hypothetical protein